MQTGEMKPFRSALDQARVPAEDLLPIYLGKRTSERVLIGEAKRGTGEKIHAVIWLCDLRDSTLLSETLSLDNFFGLLSDYFDCTAGAVLAHGGEILSYIGDAVFAIFPVGKIGAACNPEERACAAALQAAREACRNLESLNRIRQERGETVLKFGLALHVGDVMYGNIGVSERLQFTVIGAAANEAARVAALCKTLGQSVLISSAFPRCFPNEMTSLGFHRFRGVKHPQEIFTLTQMPTVSTSTQCRQPAVNKATPRY
jgi:adenylate cyclase